MLRPAAVPRRRPVRTRQMSGDERTLLAQVRALDQAIGELTDRRSTLVEAVMQLRAGQIQKERICVD